MKSTTPLSTSWEPRLAGRRWKLHFGTQEQPLRGGLTVSGALQKAKREASFAGTMRKNLVKMQLRLRMKTG